jgi:hypothetical protein
VPWYQHIDHPPLMGYRSNCYTVTICTLRRGAVSVVSQPPSPSPSC